MQSPRHRPMTVSTGRRCCLHGFALVLVVTAALLLPGQAAASPVTKVYSSGNLNLPIADSVQLFPGAISAEFTFARIAVPDEGTVLGVKVRIRLQHALGSGGLFDFLSLGSPDRPEGDEGETSATVSNKFGDFGTGAADCSGTPAVLDDAAPTAIETSTPPFVGSYRPVDPFSTLAGVPLKGEWDLSFLDVTPGSGGTLYCWELEVTYEPPSPDLTLTVKDTPDPVKVGKKLTYAITAANVGAAPATGVVVTDTLPAGATFLAAGPPGAQCTPTGRTVRCKVGDLAPGESARIKITVRAPKKPGRLVDVASVVADQEDPNPEGNRVTATTRVRRP